MNAQNVIVYMTHPPYPTRLRSGPSVDSPLPEHVDIAFRYAMDNGHCRVGDIWIKWNIKDDEGELLDLKELLIAVSKDLDCCFVARVKEQNGLYENLVWNHGPGSKEIITVEDSGCGEWRFNAGSKIPVADAIALAKRFVAEGYIGDDLEWEFEPTAS
jgi:hypothetical protein